MDPNDHSQNDQMEVDSGGELDVTLSQYFANRIKELRLSLVSSSTDLFADIGQNVDDECLNSSAQAFVEYFRMCLTSSPSVFSSQIDPNTFRSESEELYSENELRVFSKWIYRVCGAFLLCGRLTSLHAEIYNLMSPLFRTLKHNHSQILVESISALVGMVMKLLKESNKPRGFLKVTFKYEPLRSSVFFRAPISSIPVNYVMNILKIILPHLDVIKKQSSIFVPLLQSVYFMLQQSTVSVEEKLEIVSVFCEPLNIGFQQAKTLWCDIIIFIIKMGLKNTIPYEAGKAFLELISAHEFTTRDASAHCFLVEFESRLYTLILDPLFKDASYSEFAIYVVDFYRRVQRAMAANTGDANDILRKENSIAFACDVFQNLPVALPAFADVIHKELFRILDYNRGYLDPPTILEVQSRSPIWSTIKDAWIYSVKDIEQILLGAETQNDKGVVVKKLLERTAGFIRLLSSILAQGQLLLSLRRMPRFGCIDNLIFPEEVINTLSNLLGFQDEFAQLIEGDASDFLRWLFVLFRELGTLAGDKFDSIQTKLLLTITLPYFSEEVHGPLTAEQIQEHRDKFGLNFVEQCLEALGSELLLHCQENRIAVAVIEAAMRNDSPQYVKGVLRLIGGAKQIIREIGKDMLLNYIEAMTKSRIWIEDEEIGILLAKAICRIGCVLSKANGVANSNTTTPRNGACEVCETGSHFFEPNNCKMQGVRECIIYLIKNGSPAVHFEILESMLYLKRHGLIPNPGLVANFLQVIREPIQFKVLVKLLRNSVPFLTVHFTKSETVKNSVKMFRMIFVHLRSFLMSRGPEIAMEGLVDLLDALESVARESTDWLAIEIARATLLVLTLNWSMSIGSKCQLVFRYLAEARQLKTSEYMGQIREYILPDFLEMCLFQIFGLVEEQLVDAEIDAINTKRCEVLLRAFEHTMEFRREDFTRIYFPVLLSLTIPMGFVDRRARLFITSLAQFGLVTAKELLEINFTYYFPALAVNCSTATEINGIIKFLDKVGLSPGLLTSLMSQGLMNEILSYFSVDKEKVKRLLSSLLLLQPGGRLSISNSIAASDLEIRQFITERLMGFVVYLDCKMDSHFENVAIKRRVYNSLVEVIAYLGTSISGMKMRIAKLFNRCTRKQYLHDLLPKGWKVYTLNLDDSVLPSMMNEILASVVHLKTLQNVDIGQTLEEISYYIISEKNRVTRDFRHQVYYMQEHIQNRQTVSLLRNGKYSGIKFLEYLIESLKNGNVYIRYQAILAVQHIVTYDNTSVDLKELLEDSQFVHPNVCRLILALLECIQSQDKDVVHLTMTVMGQLGAVDYYRMKVKSSERQSRRDGATIFPTGIPFAHAYIEMLRKQYQGTELSLPSDIDICAYAVQEVLRIYRVGVQNSGHPVWATLPPETKSLFSALITSKFSLKDVVPLQEYPSPLYGSNLGETFQDWCTNFVILMYKFVVSQPAKEIFRVTLPLLVRSLPVALYLLPYVALFASLDGSASEKRIIYRELRRICKLWWLSGEPVSDASNTVKMNVPFEDDSHFEEPPADDATVAERLSVTNAVFSIVDLVSFVSRYGASNFAILNNIATTGCTGLGNSSSPASSVTGSPLTTQRLQGCRSILPDPMCLARAAFQTQSYQRALLNLEEHLFHFPEMTQDYLSFLQRIFIALEDMDGVIGVSAIRKGKPNIYEETLELLATAKKEDAASKFQLMIQKGFSDFDSENVLMQAYLSIEKPEMALTVMNGLALSSNRKEVRSSPWDDCRIEACWKLQEWDDLKTNLKGTRADLSSRGSLMHAAILSLFQRKHYDAVLDIIGQAREKCLLTLSSADTSIDSYHSRYAEITRLHIYCEIEQSVDLMKAGDKSSSREADFQPYRLKATNLMKSWKDRLNLVQKSLNIVEPIVNTRKALLHIMKDNSKRHSISRLFASALRDCCLTVTKLEIRAKNFGRANACIQEARQFRSPEVFIQDAKFVALRGDMDRGIRIMNDCMKQYFSSAKIRAWEDLPETAPLEPDQELCAKSLLLLAKFNDEKCNVDMDVNIKNYLQVTEVHKKSEKNFFHLANYCDTIVNSSSHQSRQTEMQQLVVQYYCKSLEYGSKHVYQSLPRLLFVWLNYASNPPSKTAPKEVRDVYSKTVNQMSSYVAKLYSTVPPYIFLTVYSQLISRVCHPNAHVWLQLKDMIAGVVVAHHHQALWMMMAVSKSTYKMRKSRCTEILRAVEEKAPALKTLINDYSILADHLIELATSECSDSKTTSIENVAPSLVKLLKKPNFSPILMPFQQFLTVAISRVGSHHMTHKPFQQTPVFIQSIEKNVQIMPSLQRPKKITLRGSDGRLYGVMCKPDDDLRKDSKVMEMNNIVNWYLRKDPEARERNLYVRTYAVVALNEDTGLLEWVPNLQGLRPLLQKIYKEKQLHVGPAEVKTLYPTGGGSSQAKLDGFFKLVNRHPPVLREWFLTYFSDPQEWYTARSTFTRTCAVMSMVGYLIGLGDRHGENISLDSISGDVVHVDFNCLFNKGETFDVPEVVPFRLTHNMVNAMGPLGSEGPFRRSCEITVQILRQNAAVFMSVLRPFVFDPLVEWSKIRGVANQAATSTTGEVSNSMAVDNIKAIQLRLDGVARNLTKELNVPLSVEAQVSYLIKEATAPTNLCQMYIGWSAYY